MGSLEKTVKVATCFNRLSAQLLSSLPWVTPPPKSGKASPSSSSSPTQPTTWQSSEELPSNELSLPELSRDLAVSVMTAMRLTAEKRTEKADLTMVTQATPHQLPTLHQQPPPPPPPPTTQAYVAPTTVAPVYKPAPVVYRPTPV